MEHHPQCPARPQKSGAHVFDAYLGVALLALIVVLYLYTLLVLPYLEVRDRGLLHRGRLISWLVTCMGDGSRC